MQLMSMNMMGGETKMKLQDFLHMNEGDGEFSYSQNSFVQKGASLMSQPMVEKAIEGVISDIGRPKEGFRVADLGCGVGPVPLGLVTMVIQYVERKCKEFNQLNNEDNNNIDILVYFNDLPSNDFNFLLRNLFNLEVLKRKDGKALCFLMATPGSYYARLFPANSLHFVHANYTLHWLSQTPAGLYSAEGVALNKGNIYISETSPENVAKAYFSQFQQDFSKFLNNRSKEVLSKGRMLLTFRGRDSLSNVTKWQPWELKILTQSITTLISQGLMKEEKLDTFNFPYYGPCEEEIQYIVKTDGSFEIENINTVTQQVHGEIKDDSERAKAISKFVRSFSESLISSHFGEDISDLIYHNFTKLTNEHLANGELLEHSTIIVLLKKI